MYGEVMDKKKKRLLKLAVKDCFIILMLIMLVTIVLNFRFIRDDTMHPALEKGDLLVIYCLEKPQRGEIAAYKQAGEIRYGRIIASGDDTVEITENELLYINSNLASEEIFYPTALPDISPVTYPLRLPSDTFFILNDNRTITDDSREHGVVEGKDVIGSVIYVIRLCRH